MNKDHPMLSGAIHFKIRFNNMHGDTDFFWRVIIDHKEYLVKGVKCNVPTYSDESFDERANALKYHIAGDCGHFTVGDDGVAVFS